MFGGYYKIIWGVFPILNQKNQAISFELLEGKLVLKDMMFFAYHGGIKEESTLGQKFIVDLDLFYDMEEPCITDNLNTAFSYLDVYSIVERIMTQERHNLLQHLGYRIAEELILVKPDSKAIVTIKKPSSPIKGIFDYAAIQIVAKGPEYQKNGGM